MYNTQSKSSCCAVGTYKQYTIYIYNIYYITYNTNTYYYQLSTVNTIETTPTNDKFVVPCIL